MTKFKSISLVVLTLAFFTACGGGGGGTTSTTTTSTTTTSTTTPPPNNTKLSSDLNISMFISNPRPNVGSTVLFDMVAINKGPDNDTNVTVSDLLPSGYRYNSHKLTRGNYNAATGVWDIGNLANQTGEILEINATVLPTGIYTNVATIHGSNVDSIPTDNSMQITPTILTSTTPPPTTNVTINAPVQVVPLGKSSVNVNVNITNGPKDLYILLSNYSTVLGSSPAITHNPKTVASVQPKKGLNILQSSMKHKIHAPKEVEAFRTKSFQYLQQGKRSSSTREAKIFASTPIRQADVVGNVGNFQLNITAGVTTAATARKVVSAQTAFGMKTLNIWVSNDSFDAGAGCLKTNCVTQAMVDALAVRFLQTGTDNDIYDWVTNIYGTEWGAYAAANYGNLIPYDGNITILLTDIGNDNSTNGGVLGYFYAKDNYLPSTASGSNQRVMFYLDSVLFATPSGGTPWTITDLWPREMISTLAHEFQHMITFYQKGVLLNSQPPQTWLSEMLAETTEDVVATRLLGNGPRNVPYTDGSAGTPFNTGGRYPLFNNDPTLSLTNWSGIVDDYSKVSAFGTFLIRNYGGAKLLHDMVANTLTGTDAVVQAVHLTPQGAGKTFDDLLTEWGVAVLLSDRTNLPVGMPQYNTGAFTLDTYNGNGINYQLGSINFFNYLPQPNIATASGTVNPQGNYYYKVGTALSGLVQIGLTLNGNTQATLIAK